MQQAMSSSTASLRGQRLRQARPTPGVAAAGRRPLRAQALFGFLAPPKAKAGAGKAQELVGQLLELVERSDGGLSTPPAKREEIAELVAELEGLGTRNPLRSPLLFGDYEVVYTSKPQAAGGAYRSPLGRVVFPGQRAVQRLAQPNICINEVSYKALGFIPGSVRQEGEFEAVSGDTLKLVFPDTDSKAKNGPPRRVIQIAYLDERIRVARAIPPEEAEEAEPTLFVFRRIVEDEDEEAEEDEAPAQRAAPLSFGTRKIKAAAQEQAQPARRGVLGTQLLGRKDGLATMAEKRYAQQQGGSRSTGTISRKGTGTTGRGTGTTSAVRKTREELAAERAAARAAAEEERRAAREAAEAARAAAREQAAKAKAAAEEERRARQAQLEAERARAAEVKEAARKQLAQLQGEASEAADEAKAAASAAKDAEKAASELLKQASQARGLIDQAASAAAAALQQLDGLKGQEKEAAGVVAESRRALAALETASRRR